MATTDVILIDVGQPAWPRWMIFHTAKRRYWANGVWKKRRRNGDLWNSKAEAEQELHVVRLGS